MATIESIKTKIQTLTTKINETTNKSDTDLTTAVNSLINGYKQHGNIATYKGEVEVK